LDVGVYCLQFASLVFGGDRPIQILSGGHLNEDRVDESTSTTLIYSGGRTATLLTHYGLHLPSDALAIGTKGTLKVRGNAQRKRSILKMAGAFNI
jgi:dihydrodiol dehydrogenase / D-xylose 1-dehydrogenase (NADP)